MNQAQKTTLSFLEIRSLKYNGHNWDWFGIGLGLVWGVTVRLFFLARLAVGCPASPGFRPGLGRDRPGNFFSKVTREGYLSA